MFEYWGRVCARAWSEAAEAVGLDSRHKIMTKVIVGVAIVLVLAFYGSKDASTDEMVVRGAAVALVVFIFPFVYVWKFISVPAKMESESRKEADNIIREKSAEIQELRDSLGKGLAIMFEQTPEFCPNPVSEPVYIAVRNDSPKQTIEGLQVFITGNYEGGDRELALVRRDGTDEPVDIHSGKTEYFEVARCGIHGHIVLCSDMSQKLEPKRYRVKIKAYGKNTPSVNGIFLLKMKNDRIAFDRYPDEKPANAAAQSQPLLPQGTG